MPARAGLRSTCWLCVPNWRSDWDLGEERPTPSDSPAGALDTVDTIYLGGGTPTVLPRELLLDLVRDLAVRLHAPPEATAAAGGRAAGGIAGAPARRAAATGALRSTRAEAPLGGSLPEFTIEANPGTIDTQLLRLLAEAGVTRLSLGVQSFAPALRAALGRRVAQREIEQALEAVRLAGWREWSLDLVFGIPGQTWAGAAADIDAAVAAGPAHISMYDLTYTPAYLARLESGRRATRRAGGAPEAGPAAAPAGGAAPASPAAAAAPSGTPESAPAPGAPGAAGPDASPVMAAPGAGAREAAPAAAPAAGAMPAADPDDLGDAFAETYFAAAVARLEAAGYRRYEVSNFALPGHECLHNLAYWRGEDYVGLGASAVSTMGGARRTNPRSVAAYLRGDAPEVEVITHEVRLWEMAMLGLRTIEGVDEREVSPVLDWAARGRLLGQGCVESRCGRLRINSGFLDVSNAVISALLVRPGGT